MATAALLTLILAAAPAGPATLHALAPDAVDSVDPRQIATISARLDARRRELAKSLAPRGDGIAGNDRQNFDDRFATKKRFNERLNDAGRAIPRPCIAP